MDRFGRTLLCVGLALACLAGCKKEDSAAAGPAEQAGRKLDEAAAKVAPQVKNLGEKAGQALQDAGQKLQQKARDGQKDEPQK